MDFCFIGPTAYLDKFPQLKGRGTHLLLAHLIEGDPAYRNWYASNKYNSTYIMDNGAFEMYKRGLPMYPSEKLLDMARSVNADYVVMTDYPGEPASKTIEAAEQLAPAIKAAGFKTFFVPQSEPGDVKGLIESFCWAAGSPLVDYIGVSILAVPLAYNVLNNPLQRMLSRWKFFEDLFAYNPTILCDLGDETKVHILGMLDGPNEILLLRKYIGRGTSMLINSWDSSAAIWAGINGISFDNSPTGLANGKFEKEVDFSHDTATPEQLAIAAKNMTYIESLIDNVEGRLSLTEIAKSISWGFKN